MSWVPSDWETERASGWWNIYNLIHKPCGFRTPFAYDLVLDVHFGRMQAKEVVFSHTCDS